MLERHPLIFNPYSGGGLSQAARQFLMKSATDFMILASKSEEDALNLLDHFLKEESPLIYVGGGDGTLNKVLPRFLDSSSTLGVLPVGTMNVFARELGISTTDFRQVLTLIEESHIIEPDIFQVNGNPFIQMAGIGYDAQIIEETCNERKSQLGPLAYAFSIAKVLGNGAPPPPLKVITAEGREIEGVCVLIGNGKLYGGHLSLFNKASNTDGLLDLLIIKSNGYQAVLDLSLNLITEDTVLKSQLTDKVDYVQTAGFTVISETEIPYELDGEYYGREKEFTFTQSEKSLRVLAPKQKPKNDWNEKFSALWSLTPLR